MRTVAVLGGDEALVRSLVLAASAAPNTVVRASTGPTIAGLARLLDAHPDVLILDEATSSWELVHGLKLRRQELRILVAVSAVGSSALASLTAGASGILLSGSVSTTLAATLDVLDHDLYVMPSGVLDLLLAERPGLADLSGVERVERLSPREREVLTHLMAGETHRQIAEALVLSVHTVRFHMKQILAKLSVHSGLEAAMLGARAGLVPARGRPTTTGSAGSRAAAGF